MQQNIEVLLLHTFLHKKNVQVRHVGLEIYSISDHENLNAALINVLY